MNVETRKQTHERRQTNADRQTQTNTRTNLQPIQPQQVYYRLSQCSSVIVLFGKRLILFDLVSPPPKQMSSGAFSGHQLNFQQTRNN